MPALTDQASLLSQPLISALMPVYNGAAFIAEAVESVLAQTYANWELIVIDDGSSDCTAQIVSAYRNSRIRYHYQSNQGLASARNTGLQFARGEFVAFIDADDKWAPEFLSRCYAALSSDHDTAAVYTQSYYLDQHSHVLPGANRTICRSDQLYRRLLQSGFFPPCAVMARTQIIREQGMFDTQLNGLGAEDWDLWLRLSSLLTMTGVPELLAYYRVYSGSMSTNAEPMHAARLRIMQKHFGSWTNDQGPRLTDKQLAYGHVYQRAALDYLMQHQSDMAWQYMTQAIGFYPRMLERIETYYELACGDQTRGYRGTPIGLDLDRNGAAMLAWLDRLFAPSNTALAGYRRTAYARAYLSLSMLSDAIKRRPAARRFMWYAIKSDPRLLAKVWIVRRCVKLVLGL